ncbi:hypothetical protein H9Q70_013031 [Fusarium xylarioides]|nr:hypothetical protein H9Q70_013031 [Fusarium xylarioides]
MPIVLSRSMMEKQNTLERIAQRAKAAGYQYGEHLDDDKQRDRPVTEDTEKTRAQVFHVYKAWLINQGMPPEECETSFLSAGSPLPEMVELKDFWRFYALQSTGRITLPDSSKSSCPTVGTLLGKAKAWKAGFLQRTGQELSAENTTEINETQCVSGIRCAVQGSATLVCNIHILRYDSVAIILMLAVADGALDLKDLDQMIKSSGEGQVDWAEKCLDLPVCRRVNRKGDVDDTQPMTPDSFITMFKTFMMQAGYAAIPGSLFPPGSIHMIRRELGKQLDERYTEVERSQHLTQADKAVFGQSYTADTSSCDGLSAFLHHQPDHTAIEYFQGLSQFRHEGLPTQLPAVLKDKTSRHPEVLRWDQKIAEASDAKTQTQARQKRQKALDRLQRETLEDHRRESLVRLKREKLFNLC